MKRNWITRSLVLGVVGVMALGTVSACSSIAAPDYMGLYYMEGNIDGYKFDHCYDPGSTTDAEWNNSTVLLPVSLRTWKISEDSTDSTRPIRVPSKPQAEQPGGVMMNIWTQTNFMLNTHCGANNDDVNSPIVHFWEKIGRRYNADTVDGWKIMLENTIVTALTTVTANVIRDYEADVLVSGTKKEEIQSRISNAFTPELKRLVGGDYFCGPTFSRQSETCPPVQVLLLPVDYANEGIQAARDEKQAAIERAAATLAEAQGQAAALVAEATGKVNAANLEGQLYNNPGWVELQKAEIQRKMVVEACSVSPNCTLILGSDGTVLGTRS